MPTPVAHLTAGIRVICGADDVRTVAHTDTYGAQTYVAFADGTYTYLPTDALIFVTTESGV